MKRITAGFLVLLGVVWVGSVRADEALMKAKGCAACHAVDKMVVGPAYKEVAKRGYSNERIVQLIGKPEPKNWPGYSTEMAPMPQVPKTEALKIAAWINSLK